MKYFFPNLLLLITALLPAQTVWHKFPPEINCDSVKRVSREYFNAHHLKAHILDTVGLPIKKERRLIFPFGESRIIFEDEPGFELGYIAGGIDKKRNWVLVELLEGCCPEFFLVNTKHGTTDTLAGFPYLFDDLLIAMEPDETDDAGVIQIWKIEGDSLKLLTQFGMAKCLQSPTNDFPSKPILFLSDKNELLIKVKKYPMLYDEYWKIDWSTLNLKL